MRKIKEDLVIQDKATIPVGKTQFNKVMYLIDKCLTNLNQKITFGNKAK